MHFEILGEIQNIEIISIGGNILDIMRIQKDMGKADGENLKAQPIWRRYL